MSTNWLHVLQQQVQQATTVPATTLTPIASSLFDHQDPLISSNLSAFTHNFLPNNNLTLPSSSTCLSGTSSAFKPLSTFERNLPTNTQINQNQLELAAALLRIQSSVNTQPLQPSSQNNQLHLLQLLQQQQPQVSQPVQQPTPSLSLLQQLMLQLNQQLSMVNPNEAALQQQQGLAEKRRPASSESSSCVAITRKRSHDNCSKTVPTKKAAVTGPNTSPTPQPRSRSNTNPTTSSTPIDPFDPKEMSKYRTNDPNSPYRHHPINQVRNENAADAFAAVTLHLIGFTDMLSRYLIEHNMTIDDLERAQDDHDQAIDWDKVNIDDLDFIDKKTGLPNVKLIRHSVMRSMSKSIKSEEKQDGSNAGVKNGPNAVVPLIAS